MKEMSNIEHHSIFDQFCQGRDSIELGELNVEWEDFDMLIGAPPYPSMITSNPDFPKQWPRLRAVIHGVMAYRYIAYCDEQVGRCQKHSAGHIRKGLNSTYHGLALDYNDLVITARRLRDKGDKAGAAVASLYSIWISRIMVDTVEDMVTLREGCARLIRTLTDRKWEVQHGRR